MSWYRRASDHPHIRLHSGIVVKPSRIDGHGAFPSCHHREGDIVYALVVPHPKRPSDSCRTEAARMTNHSSSPTMRPVRVGNTVHAVATRPLSPDDECTIDYREVLPLLTQHPGLSAGSILRETDGIEHIVSDDSHTNLFEQLADIIDGKYNEMEKSAQSDDDPSADQDDAKYDLPFERLVHIAEKRTDSAKHLEKLLSTDQVPSWLTDRLPQYIRSLPGGVPKWTWWGDWATRQIMTEGTELQKVIRHFIFDDSMKSHDRSSDRPDWAYSFFQLIYYGESPEWMIKEFRDYVARNGHVPPQLWSWSRKILEYEPNHPLVDVIRSADQGYRRRSPLIR